jgi:hypothetical protein
MERPERRHEPYNKDMFLSTNCIPEGSVLLSLLLKAENGSVMCKPAFGVAFSVLIIAKFVASPLLAIPAAQSVKLLLYKPHDVRKKTSKTIRIKDRGGP